MQLRIINYAIRNEKIAQSNLSQVIFHFRFPLFIVILLFSFENRLAFFQKRRDAFFFVFGRKADGEKSISRRKPSSRFERDASLTASFAICRAIGDFSAILFGQFQVFASNSSGA
jgi:hypothetical protein